MHIADLDQLKAPLSDRYAIDHEIGRGGVATVYVAEDLKHRRKVAIKVMRPELSVIHSVAIHDSTRCCGQMNLESDSHADETHRCWELGTREQWPQS
jgi:serine/threonine protein kinase